LLLVNIWTSFFLAPRGVGMGKTRKFFTGTVINSLGLRHFRSYQNAIGDFDDN